MTKVVLEGYIVVPEDDLGAVRSELANHIRLTQSEPGCVTFQVGQDETDACRFNVYEEFVDRAAFEEHQKRVGNSAWGRVTKNVERHYQVSERA